MIRRAHAHGRDVIPVVPFADIASGAVDPHAVTAIRTHGAVVIRGVFDPQQARDWNDEIGAYLDANRFTDRLHARAEDRYFGNLASGKPQIYGVYWSKPQVAARQSPALTQARVFLNRLWRHADGGRTHFDPDQVPAYADRIRRRPPGSTSLGLSPHVDGGSVERWLGANFRRVYRHVLAGRWRDYDPFDAAFRPDVEEIPSPAVCSMFRTFQGWTALTPQGPGDGTLQLIPVANAMAYVVLRALQDDVADDDLCGAPGPRAVDPARMARAAARRAGADPAHGAGRCGVLARRRRARGRGCAPRQRRQQRDVHRRRARLREERRVPAAPARCVPARRARPISRPIISRSNSTDGVGGRSHGARPFADGVRGGRVASVPPVKATARRAANGGLPNPLRVERNSTQSAAGAAEIDANCAIWLPIMVRTQRSRPV